MKIHVSWAPGHPTPTQLETKLIELALITHHKVLVQRESIHLILDRVVGRTPPKAAPTPEDAQTRCLAALTEFAREMFPEMDVTFTVEPSDYM